MQIECIFILIYRINEYMGIGQCQLGKLTLDGTVRSKSQWCFLSSVHTIHKFITRYTNFLNDEFEIFTSHWTHCYIIPNSILNQINRYIKTFQINIYLVNITCSICFFHFVIFAIWKKRRNHYNKQTTIKVTVCWVGRVNFPLACVVVACFGIKHRIIAMLFLIERLAYVDVYQVSIFFIFIVFCLERKGVYCVTVIHCIL